MRGKGGKGGKGAKANFVSVPPGLPSLPESGVAQYMGISYPSSHGLPTGISTYSNIYGVHVGFDAALYDQFQQFLESQ